MWLCVKSVCVLPDYNGSIELLSHLKITLASLVADGAVERMVDQQKLHHSLPVWTVGSNILPSLTTRPSLSSSLRYTR